MKGKEGDVKANGGETDSCAMETGEHTTRPSSLSLRRGGQTQLKEAKEDSSPRDGGRKVPQLLTGKTGHQAQDRLDPVPSTAACLLQHAITAARDTQP